MSELKFKGMAGILPELLLPPLQEELLYRKECATNNRLAYAKIPWTWALNSFPFDRQPAVDKTRIMTLAGLDFMNRG